MPSSRTPRRSNFLGGVNYTHETYSNGTEIPPTPPSTTPTEYSSLTADQQIRGAHPRRRTDHKLGKSTVVTQNFYFYPDLQQTGEYRGTFNLGTVTKISKWLGWQNQFGDIYVSNPPTGAKKNDLVFTTGLNIAFAH